MSDVLILGISPRLSPVLRDLLERYDRAIQKHGPYSLDGDEIDDMERLAALMEEVGEVARHLTYDHKNAPDMEQNLYSELLDVANVAITWASVLYRPVPNERNDTSEKLETIHGKAHNYVAPRHALGA